MRFRRMDRLRRRRRLRLRLRLRPLPRCSLRPHRQTSQVRPPGLLPRPLPTHPNRLWMSSASSTQMRPCCSTRPLRCSHPRHHPQHLRCRRNRLRLRQRLLQSNCRHRRHHPHRDSPDSHCLPREESNPPCPASPRYPPYLPMSLRHRSRPGGRLRIPRQNRQSTNHHRRLHLWAIRSPSLWGRNRRSNRSVPCFLRRHLTSCPRWRRRTYTIRCFHRPFP